MGPYPKLKNGKKGGNMPTQKELRAAMSKNLQEAVKHPDPDSGRLPAIKRGVGILQDNFVEHIKYFKVDKMKFFHNVFQDEGCWSGVRLDNAALGQRFTEEKVGGIDNPLRRYDMACRYCVVDKIFSLFEKKFDYYKRSFSSIAVNGNGYPVKDNNKYILNSLLYEMKREDPVLNFWIDKESGKLKKYDAVEGFDSAVKLKWSEGVEYFYSHLKEEGKEKKLTEAILTLSRVPSVEKDASILDFCVNGIVYKDTLLQKLLKKDRGVYALVGELIESCFFDTVHDLVQCWCFNDVSAGGDHSVKIFSQDEYDLLLYSLSNAMLKNPESSTQVRSLIMKIWKCDCFIEYRKISVNISNCIVPVQDMLAGLIVNWKREDIYKPDERKEIEKKEILDVILFAKDCFPEKFEFFKNLIIRNLRLCGREGMEESINYDDLAKELFSELEKTTLHPGGDGHNYNLQPQLQAHGSKKTSFPLDDSGHGRQSKFEDSSVSGVSKRRK